MEEKKNDEPDKKKAFASSNKMFHMNSSLRDEDYDDGDILKVQPIADLFPNTTVLFADIVGFTAWSSTREPSSVFILLKHFSEPLTRLLPREMSTRWRQLGTAMLVRHAV